MSQRAKTSILAVAGLLTITPAAFARQADCMVKAVTNADFAACSKLEIKAADAALNASWKRLFNDYGGSRTDAGRALLAEQRAWIAFRSKACKEYFLADAGRENAVLHGPMCIASIIQKRADDLKGRYELANPDSL